VSAAEATALPTAAAKPELATATIRAEATAVAKPELATATIRAEAATFDRRSKRRSLRRRQ